MNLKILLIGLFSDTPEIVTIMMGLCVIFMFVAAIAAFACHSIRIAGPIGLFYTVFLILLLVGRISFTAEKKELKTTVIDGFKDKDFFSGTPVYKIEIRKEGEYVFESGKIEPYVIDFWKIVSKKEYIKEVGNGTD